MVYNFDEVIDRRLVSLSPGVVQTISAAVRLFTPEGGSVLENAFVHTPEAASYVMTAMEEEIDEIRGR